MYFSNSPLQVVSAGGSPLAGALDLYAGADAFCAVTASSVYCWGKNASGMLGFPVPPTSDNVLAATQVSGAPALKPMAMGMNFQLGITDGTNLYAWGQDQYGTVDPAASGAIFSGWNTKSVTTTTAMTQVSAGAQHGCVLYVTGEVQCFGNNLFGALGNGTPVGGGDPIPGHKISGFSATRITSGAWFMCAQTSNANAIHCWGNNINGVIAPDIATNYPTPTAVALSVPPGVSISEVVSSATANHVCTIMSNGSLMCWGSNGSLECGTGSTNSNVTAPAMVQANW